MSILEVPLSEDIYLKIKEFSKKESITPEYFASTAIEEKLACFSEEEYFMSRFGNKTKEDFLRALANVPDVEPPEYDRL